MADIQKERVFNGFGLWYKTQVIPFYGIKANNASKAWDIILKSYPSLASNPNFKLYEVTAEKTEVVIND